MMRASEISVGDQVHYIRYGDSIESGKVIAIKERGSNWTTDKIVIEKSDTWEVLELDKIFATRQEAVLHRAMELQQEASGKLAVAARLFKEAGVMKDAPAG